MNNREAFDAFVAKRYEAAREKALAALDGFSDEECLAIVDSVRASISARIAWAISHRPRPSRNVSLVIDGRAIGNAISGEKSS